MMKILKKYWWILIIVLAIFLMVQVALADQREAADKLKLYFGELVIVHPEDIKISGLRMEEIPYTFRYRLSGNVTYEDMKEEFEVIMQKNEYGRGISGKWTLYECTTCPARKSPRGDEEFILWKEIYDLLQSDGA